jgi:hypothetical protein
MPKPRMTTIQDPSEGQKDTVQRVINDQEKLYLRQQSVAKLAVLDFCSLWRFLYRTCFTYCIGIEITKGNFATIGTKGPVALKRVFDYCTCFTQSLITEITIGKNATTIGLVALRTIVD